MSRTKHLISLLDACEKHEFDEVVKIYLVQEYGFKKIVRTDGGHDTGLDLKVFDSGGQSIQYQVTIQKSNTPAEERAFEKKLREDLVKAKTNHETYKYSNKLIFFHSKELTNARIRHYEKLAFKEFSIDLELIEANRIAEEAENIIDIQTLLYKANELDKYQLKASTFDDESENLMFDLISFGRASEFKVQIIEAFILLSFYTKGELTVDEIKNLCESKFKVKEGYPFYEKLINS